MEEKEFDENIEFSNNETQRIGKLVKKLMAKEINKLQNKKNGNGNNDIRNN